MNQQALGRLPVQAQNAAAIEPGTHFLMRTCIPCAAEDPGGTAQTRNALEIAARITRHGGIITSIDLTPTGQQITCIGALLTIRQAVELLLEEAHTEVEAITPPPSLFCAAGHRNDAGDEPGDPVRAWLSAKDEEARELGVQRLQVLLSDAGYTGDLGRVADELWTRCGF